MACFVLGFALLVAVPTDALAAPTVGNAPPSKEADAKAKDGESAKPEEKVAPDSPRAAMADFRHLTRKGDFTGAAAYLDLAQVDHDDGPMLARELREVLNRHLWLDLDKISPNSRGNTEDGQPADREELGSVPGASGKPEPVVLLRKSYRPGTHWVFSAATVVLIDSWYDHLENVWLMEHLPKPLLRMGPHLLRWWQWIALAPLLIAGWLVGFGITRVSRALIRRTMSVQHAKMAHQLRGPATLAWAVAAFSLALPWLGLYQPASAFVHRWCSALLLLALFWALWRGVELSGHSVSSSRWAKESLSAHSLLSLGTRLAKFAVAAAAFIVVLAELGYQATTIITGLGIGGVALALAAQKTVENLFGTFSLAIDQPFREGDSIQVDTISGTVEAVGLRSTRIRTADRTLISIPNGKLADMRVETINRQDRLRLYCLLGLAHGPSKQLTRVLSDIERLLREEPLVAQDTVSVRFVALTDAAMNIEIGAMLDTIDGGKFADARQKFLLGVLQAIKQSGRKDIKYALGGNGMKEIIKKVIDGDAVTPVETPYPPSMIKTAIYMTVANLMAQAPVRGTIKLDAPLITQKNAKEYYFPDSPF